MRFACICIICFSIASCKKHDVVVTPQPQTPTTDTTKPTDTTQQVKTTTTTYNGVIYYSGENVQHVLQNTNADVLVTYTSKAGKDSTIAFRNGPYTGSFKVSVSNEYKLSVSNEYLYYKLKGDSLFAVKSITHGMFVEVWEFEGKRK